MRQDPAPRAQRANALRRELCLVEFDDIEVILNTTRAQSFDPSLFSAMGIDPKSRNILLIKSTNHFYDSFSRIASRIIYASAGKPYPNTPATTPYRKVHKAIWPRVENPFG
jgi:microcystin degradation protein MlrC